MDVSVGHAAPQGPPAHVTRACTSGSTESTWSAGGWQVDWPRCLQFQKSRHAAFAEQDMASVQQLVFMQTLHTALSLAKRPVPHNIGASVEAS